MFQQLCKLTSQSSDDSTKNDRLEWDEYFMSIAHPLVNVYM